MKSDVWVNTIKFISNLLITGIVGLVDQLEDRLLCKQEVARSNRAQSTHLFLSFPRRLKLTDLCNDYRKRKKKGFRPSVSVELSDDGLDTPDTGSRTLFFQDLESLELTGVCHVRASAEFLGHIPDDVHLDDVAVLAVEDSDGT